MEVRWFYSVHWLTSQRFEKTVVKTVILRRRYRKRRLQETFLKFKVTFYADTRIGKKKKFFYIVK